ncbi:hypothetical protein QN277_018954 [Acacia crassicarpa]|uniref:Uncharacterized protein n=1 Tax=Acacia crassicarpa TaxID=499986 RepID=A0AAE1KIF1_9FABA|nr:hypothetical protein QN277_018954 [Acacia crassicarpa]
MEYFDHCQNFCRTKRQPGPHEINSCSTCGKILSDKLSRILLKKKHSERGREIIQQKITKKMKEKLN